MKCTRNTSILTNCVTLLHPIITRTYGVALCQTDVQFDANSTLEMCTALHHFIFINNSIIRNLRIKFLVYFSKLFNVALISTFVISITSKNATVFNEASKRTVHADNSMMLMWMFRWIFRFIFSVRVYFCTVFTVHVHSSPIESIVLMTKAYIKFHLNFPRLLGSVIPFFHCIYS